MLYFEDLTTGRQVVFEDRYRVTEEEIIEVGERWDPRSFHADSEAARDSLFGVLVASSAHIFQSMCVLAMLILTKAGNQPRSALWALTSCNGMPLFDQWTY